MQPRLPTGGACEFEPLALRFSRLITGSGRVIQDAVAIVEGDRIRSVGTVATLDMARARLVDLRPFTAIPGMIDVHTHMTYCWDQTLGSRPWDQFGTLSAAVTVFLSQENARKTLESGVTTVRDLGALDGADFAMRDLINRGAMQGPRMFVAGYPLLIDRGRDHCLSLPSESRPTVRGAAAVQEAAREQLAKGADWVKLFGSTGGGDDLTSLETFDLEEMKAAAEVAHQAGKRFAVHAYGAGAAHLAVMAGADSVEHAVDIDDATFLMMVERGVVYVPTVDHNRYYIDHCEEFGYGDSAVDGLNAFIRRNLETLRRAIGFNVKIAMGSDAVITMFGENTRELEWFVRAGMSPAQALKCATAVGAELLGMPGELGTVAPNAFADVVAIDGDPHKSIEAIRNVRWVMKAGAVVVDRR